MVTGVNCKRKSSLLSWVELNGIKSEKENEIWNKSSSLIQCPVSKIKSKMLYYFDRHEAHSHFGSSGAFRSPGGWHSQDES